jgi:hypothetical protein
MPHDLDEKAVEALAQAWASIDGKLDAYQREAGMSVTEHAADPGFTGHWAGYQEESAEMIRRLRKRGFTLAAYESAKPAPEPSAEMARGVRILNLSPELLEIINDPENMTILPGNFAVEAAPAPLSIGSRLTVDGVEAVVVPVMPSEAMLDAYWHQTGESREMRSRTHASMCRYYSAMLSPEALGGGE